MSGHTAQQPSVDELRTQISQRLRSSAAFSQTVYQDQPIIMTGAQLKSFVPDSIREARQLARSLYAQNASVVDVFYQQARLLAGYEDDFEFTGEFSRYFPTYEDMGNEQLRGYFAWRTKVRRGIVEQGSLSFAYVYLYELINLVGVPDAQEGYEALVAFGDAYRRFDARFGQLLDAWIDDFVIYYGLDTSLLRMSSYVKRDEAFDVLLHHESHADDKLFDALVTLGAYAIGDSPFFVEHETELKQLVAHGYRTANQHHAKLKTTLPAKLAGHMSNNHLRLFDRAIFANPLGIDNAKVAISPHDTVYCRNGAWFRTRYENLERPLPWVTQLLETCECILRDAYAYPNTLERTLTTKYLVKAIETRANELVEEARLREQRAVHIDFGKLDHIRAAADVTCEKLIVEEEEATCDEGDQNTGMEPPASGDGAVAQTVLGTHGSATGASASMRRREASPFRETRFVHPSPDATRIKVADSKEQCPLPSEPSPLTSDEMGLVSCLLAGSSIREFEREHACMASVLVDSINEKLYDEFADICIDTCTGEPAIIEDYAAELRDLLGID